MGFQTSKPKKSWSKEHDPPVNSDRDRARETSWENDLLEKQVTEE